MTRLMTVSLATAFALSGCASLQADRSATWTGSPVWRDLGSPAPSAATGGSMPAPEAESPELDEGKF